MTANQADRIEIAALLILGLGAAGAVLLVLISDPGPAFSGGSLRRAASRMLGPPSRAARGRQAADELGRSLWKRRWRIVPIFAIAMLAMPVTLTWGPLATVEDSTTYLDTIWVVVAASLGLSVAMVAFAFQAFMTGGRRLHGGTLLEFADETLLLDAIRLGVLSLFVTGAVLLRFGHDAPHGWAAGWATVLSALTLLAVPYVVRRVVISLDERELLRMRSRRLKATVTRAIQEQLIGQAARFYLQETRMPVTQALMTPDSGLRVCALAAGEVRDVKLGRLARMIRRRQRRGDPVSCELAVGLGDKVNAGGPIMWLHGLSSKRPPRWIRRCVVMDRKPSRAEGDLNDLLELLHQQGLEAAREGRLEQWRQISDGYELALLELPAAAARFDMPFDGEVARPGVFGFGPLQKIQRYLFAELRAAVKSDHEELVDAIAYFPAHIARGAIEIEATTIATTMLELYPAMYVLAQRGSQ